MQGPRASGTDTSHCRSYGFLLSSIKFMWTPNKHECPPYSVLSKSCFISSAGPLVNPEKVWQVDMARWIRDAYLVKTLCCPFSSTITYGLLQNLQQFRGTGFGIIHTCSAHHLPHKQVHPFCTINRQIFRGQWILNINSSSSFSIIAQCTCNFKCRCEIPLLTKWELPSLK